ncbi:hypothetical protein EII40_03655 [Tannerella forsythia]|uniref:Tetratricopeptide repeat protein n=2 Tax=Tannerella forsythia TaxID=28112 RepID=A0A3P1XWF8_TANFO|nr:hypothetical protein EII40_03655 [Tannerella forsythia]
MDIKKQIRQTFVSKARGLKNAYHNGSDIFYFDIPEEKKRIIRNNFQLSFDKDILFFRDTSFWSSPNKGLLITALSVPFGSSSNQGMVITTSGIRCLPDNNSPEELYHIDWEVVSRVEYKDMDFYFFTEDEDGLQFNITFFFKKNNVNPESAQYLAEILTEIAGLCESQDPRLEMIAKILMLTHEKKYSEANAVMNEYQALYGYHPILGWEKVVIAMEQKEFPKAQYESERLLQAIEEADNPEEWNEQKGGALNAIGYIYLQQENYAEARRYYFNSIQFAAYDESKNFRHQKFQDIDRKYSEHFAELDFNQRKLLLPVNKINSLDSKQIAVMRMDLLGALQFPIGHPIADQLYVAHPYISGRYIPFEDYDLTFLEDRLREFCWLAQCLGATEVTIESEKDTSNDKKQNSKTSYSLEASTIKGAVAGSYNNNREYSRFEELSNRLSLNQKFSPSQKPFVPEGLVWYEHEASWKRLTIQRLQGGLLEHVEKMASNNHESAMVKASDLVSLKAEFMKLTKIEGQYKKEVESSFKKKENISLRIHVTFAPINQLNGTNHSEPAQLPDHLTEKEKEYIEEYKECYASNNGDFSAKEVRLLERIRTSLGISDDRAAELEKMVCSDTTLTEDELEYLEEYKQCMAEGEITDSERRLLNKIRDTLGISEQRALEIESLIKS